MDDVFIYLQYFTGPDSEIIIYSELKKCVLVKTLYAYPINGWRRLHWLVTNELKVQYSILSRETSTPYNNNLFKQGINVIVQQHYYNTFK